GIAARRSTVTTFRATRGVAGARVNLIPPLPVHRDGGPCHSLRRRLSRVTVLILALSQLSVRRPGGGAPGYHDYVGLSSSAINAMVTGGHGAPFSVLGPHADGDGAITVRAFLPDAREVAVVPSETNDPPQPLRRAHPAGLWEGTLPWSSTRAYRLRLI